MSEIPGPLRQPLIVINLRPSLAGIIRAIQPILLRLKKRIHPIRICPRNRHSNSPQNSRRNALPLQTLPTVSPVHRLIQTAPGSATAQTPRRPLRLPQSRKKHIRIPRIKSQINRSSLLIFEKNLLPGLSPVHRPEYPPIRIRPISMSQRSHVHHVRVGGLGVIQDDERAGSPSVRSSPVRHHLKRRLALLRALDQVPELPAHHGNAPSKGRACRTRPTVTETTPTVTTAGTTCPTPGANGKSHAKIH